MPAAGSEAVLFDLFGTLVPVAPKQGWPEQMRQMAEPMGVPVDVFSAGFGELTAERMTGALSIEGCIRKVCAAAGVAADEARVAEAAAARAEVVREWLAPRDATLPALRRLSAAGVPLALVSDCSSDAAALWPGTPMAQFFSAAVLSASMGTKKPDARMYLTACESLGVAPGRCMYVGDGNSNELTGAEAVGLRAVHVDTERPARPGPEYEGASWAGERVSSLADIPSLLGC